MTSKKELKTGALLGIVALGMALLVLTAVIACAAAYTIYLSFTLDLTGTASAALAAAGAYTLYNIVSNLFLGVYRAGKEKR